MPDFQEDFPLSPCPAQKEFTFSLTLAAELKLLCLVLSA